MPGRLRAHLNENFTTFFLSKLSSFTPISKVFVSKWRKKNPMAKRKLEITQELERHDPFDICKMSFVTCC